MKSLSVCAVFVQDKPLAEKTRAQRHAWRFDDGTAVEMEWDRFRPTLGNSVIVTTGMLSNSTVL